MKERGNYNNDLTLIVAVLRPVAPCLVEGRTEYACIPSISNSNRINWIPSYRYLRFLSVPPSPDRSGFNDIIGYGTIIKFSHFFIRAASRTGTLLRLLIKLTTVLIFFVKAFYDHTNFSILSFVFLFVSFD
jgi:hypothetical protein